jgi:hypothetical protein
VDPERALPAADRRDQRSSIGGDGNAFLLSRSECDLLGRPRRIRLAPEVRVSVDLGAENILTAIRRPSRGSAIRPSGPTGAPSTGVKGDDPARRNVPVRSISTMRNADGQPTDRSSAPWRGRSGRVPGALVGPGCGRTSRCRDGLRVPLELREHHVQGVQPHSPWRFGSSRDSPPMTGAVNVSHSVTAPARRAPVRRVNRPG